MDFTDLITEHLPPEKRVASCDGMHERHLSEGAVMLAYAMHMIRIGATGPVGVHPDGEHGKRFPFRAWLEARGFELTETWGTTAYAGRYVHGDGHVIELRVQSGLGDVTGTVHGVPVTAECKGGIINTRHPGQQSRLAKGLHEAVGLLMASPVGGLQVAVVPETRRTRVLAERLAPRCKLAGIGISLVSELGRVTDVGAIP